MKVIAFFNAGGADKASVVYHLAWMFVDLDCNVMVADLDSRARLTELFLTYGEVERLVSEGGASTVYEALAPFLFKGQAAATPRLVQPTTGLSFLAGDVLLSSAQEAFANAWRDGEAGHAPSLEVSSAIWQLLHDAAESVFADMILVDVEAGFGPLTRASLLAADHVAMPLGPGPYAFPGLRETGTALRLWRHGWQRVRAGAGTVSLPRGDMQVVGYVALPPPLRLDRPLDAHAWWLDRLPAEYARCQLGRLYNARSVDADPNCLAVLRHFVALESLAHDVRKPIFALKPADGIVGGHADAVHGCYRDFHGLAKRLAATCGLDVA